MINIIMLTHWLGGDIYPFITLGQQFQKRGHKVTLLTHCIYSQATKKAGLEFEPVDEYSEYRNMFLRFEDFADPINNKEGTENFIREFENDTHIVKEVELIKKHIVEGADNIIICRHRSSVAGLLASEKFNIPVLSVFLAPNYVAHLQLHEQIIGDFMKGVINKAREALELKPIKCWTNWMCSPKGVIGQWPKGYASEVKEILPTIKEVGFLVKEDNDKEPLPEEIVEFLESHDEPIIISGGTSRYVCEELYQEAVLGCEKLNLPAIVVCPNEVFLPKISNDNIISVGFVNLQQLMKYARAIIHHGGINTSGEASFASIPQLILAHYADRPDNGQRLQKEKIARWLPRKMWTADNVVSCLNEILTTETKSYCENYAQKVTKISCCDSYLDTIDKAIKDDEFIMGKLEKQIINDEPSPVSVTNQLDERKKLLLKLALERKKKVG